MSSLSGLQAIPNSPLQPEGVYWQDGLYLLSTSEADGRQRWKTIILLLAGKIGDHELERSLHVLDGDSLDLCHQSEHVPVPIAADLVA